MADAPELTMSESGLHVITRTGMYLGTAYLNLMLGLLDEGEAYQSNYDHETYMAALDELRRDSLVVGYEVTDLGVQALRMSGWLR